MLQLPLDERRTVLVVPGKVLKKRSCHIDTYFALAVKLLNGRKLRLSKHGKREGDERNG